MKKMIYGLAVAAMAVGVSAFTTMESDRNENGALVDYIWYPVSGTETDCDQAGPDLTLYSVMQYPTTSQIPATAEPTPSCDGVFFCCAKGYSTSNVEKEVIAGEEYWVPKPSATYEERMRDE